MKIDRIERIKKLQREGYKVQKPHSLVLNNIYALITIVTISLVILIYTSYIQPQKENQKLQEKQTLEEKKRQEYFEQRAKQIALSHKLNTPQKEKKDDNTTSK